jgi:double-stranded uracil-DNA glycosylase
MTPVLPMMQDESPEIPRSRGFPPVVGGKPRVLILGSLPGRASLEAQQYYAQPRNSFWWIMGAICAAQPEFAYGARLAVLKRSGVALWDVLQEAVRPGSLDSDIIAASQRINDIAGLVAKHPSIELIAFNGKKAAEIFYRRIESDLPRNNLRLATLPSTSPAHASLKREEKLLLWRQVVAPHLGAN